MCGMRIAVRLHRVRGTGRDPAEWEQRDSRRQSSLLLHRDPERWHLIFKGVAAYNGDGGLIDASKAEQIAEAFRPPLSFAHVHTTGFYDDARF